MTGAAIKLLRLDLDLRQTELATLCGVCHQTLSGFERDLAPPSTRVAGLLEAFARAVPRVQPQGPGYLSRLINTRGPLACLAYLLALGTDSAQEAA